MLWIIGSRLIPPELEEDVARLMAILRSEYSEKADPLLLQSVTSWEPDSFAIESLYIIAQQDTDISETIQAIADLYKSIQLELRRTESIRLSDRGLAAPSPPPSTAPSSPPPISIEASPSSRASSGRLNFETATELALAIERSPCYVHAAIDPKVVINHVTTIDVTVYLNQLQARITNSTSQSGKAEIEKGKLLIVQVIPKTNFIAVDEGRVEVDPNALAQEPNQSITLYFDLRATHLGEGEVWVILRQGQASLLTLTLRPEIVASRELRDAAAATLLSSNEATLPSTDQKLRADGFVEELPKLNQPLHQLRIFEQRNGMEVSYQYELQSPKLDILEHYTSAPITGDRHQYVEHLYQQIEACWRSSQEGIEAFDAELRAFGGQLFDELFPLKLQQRLWNHRHELESIMVISTEPFIPWELVHLKEPGESRLPDETCFLGQMGLVRWLHEAGYPPELIRVRQERTRYVIPHYPQGSEYRLPQAEQETQFLTSRFGATRVEPQPEPVRKLVAIGDFDLLHFACHGNAEQGNVANASLMMEGYLTDAGSYVDRNLSAVTVEQYGNLKQGGNRPIVVLNSCQTGRTGYTLTGVGGFARAFLKSGAGAFVGALWSVGDRSARIFSEAFYEALLEGDNLAEATIKAREAARQSGDATWLAYAVYGHPHMKIERE